MYIRRCRIGVVMHKRSYLSRHLILMNGRVNLFNIHLMCVCVRLIEKRSSGMENPLQNMGGAKYKHTL